MVCQKGSKYIDYYNYDKKDNCYYYKIDDNKC